MKKLLAMVLALVMTVSLVATANAAKLSDMTDAEAVDSTYEVAVGLLTNAGVIAGYPDGSFRPQGNVTRAEMAKMICYALLGKTQAEQLPASSQIFSDVPVDFWAAKYIQYCYSQGIVGGHGDGTFAPNDNVTGYQAAKMILVAKGHTKDGAYEGTGWETKVAADAMKDIFKGSKTASFNAPATREEAAYYIFSGFTSSSVTYLSGLEVAVENGQYVLGAPATSTLVRDNYGRPGFEYAMTLTATGKVAKYTNWVEAKVTYLNSKIECELAQALGIKSYDETDAYFVDGSEGYNFGIDRFDTVDSIGCQGTKTEVYVYNNKLDVVQIHTYLAKVTAKYDAIKDQNGCVIGPAKDEITVYGVGSVIVDATSFAKGTFLLVEGYWQLSGPVMEQESEFIVDKMTATNSVKGKITDVVYDKFGYVFAFIVDGKTVPVNCTLTYGADLLTLGATLYLFYDANGNLIGAAETESAQPVWVINTDIVYMHSNGLTVKSHVLANLIGFDAAKLDAVKVSKINGYTPIMIDDVDYAGDVLDAEVSDNVEENGAFQLNKNNTTNYFYTYMVGTAGYELTPVEVTYATVEVKAGNPVIMVDETNFVVADNNTQFLVKNGNTYTAVKGFSGLTALKNATLWFEAEYADSVNTGKYLKRAVLDITNAIYEGSSLYAIVFDGAKQSENTKSFTIKAWADTTPSTYVVLKNADTQALYDALTFDAFDYDQWKLSFNAAGEVIKAELQTGKYYEVIAKGADVMTIKTGAKTEQLSTIGAKFYAIDEVNELVKAGKLSEVPMNDSTTYIVTGTNKATYVYYSVNVA